MLIMMVIVEDSYVDDIVFDDYDGDKVVADNDGYS